MSNVGKSWSDWLNTHVPESMRGVGNRQLLMLRVVRLNGGKYRPRTDGDRKLCESLRNRSALRYINGYYYMTNSGSAGYALLRGDEFFEKRGM